MASGNLGELWFNLGVKDSTSKTFNGILRSLKETDGSVSALRQKLEELKKTSSDKKGFDKGLRGAIKNAYDYLGMLQTINKERSKIAELKILNKDAKDLSDLERADGLLKKIKSDLMDLQKKKFGGVDDADLMPYQKALANTLKDVRNLSSAFQRDNSLSVAASNAARLKIELEKVSNKLSEIYRKQSDGMRKGYNTSYLLSAGNTIRGVKNRIGNMLGSDDLLSNESKFKSLISDIAYASEKAKGKLAEYNREKSRSIELDRNSKKEWADKVNSGFKGGSFVTPGSKEAAQGYLDIANAYKKAVDTLQTKHGEAKINLTRLLDEYNKEVKDLESKIKAISPKMDGLAWNGKKLSPKDLAAYEDLVKQLEHLKNTKGADSILAQTNFDIEERKLQRLIGLIKDYEQISERVAKGTYKPYDANSYEQKRISETAALKNAIIERYNVEQEAKNKKKKDDADAERQSKANEKQRKTELENSLRRIQSMEKALANLQEKRFASKMLGLDTSEADARIYHLKAHLNELYDIANKLGTKDMSAVGKLGNLGNGRETQAANDLARSYDKANKEAQRGVDIEQKRQQEIAKSAAKARNDLASAFAGANAEAKKMQSIVGDIKSLFLQGGIVFGAQQFFNSIVQTGGEIVQQHIALRSILGDVQKADELFNQTQQLALQSPFKFGELNRDVKQLAAFGVEDNDLYETTKRLADIASGLGVDFGRLGLAFGQVKARSWLDGKELRQFAYAGLPLLEKITELYNAEGKNNRNNYTRSDVKEMISKRMVSFEDVQKVLWKMTDEGGQFYNMQFVLSETLLGKWNKLIDAWEIMLGKFADGDNLVGGFFKMAISGATELVLALDKLSPVILSMGAVKLLGMLNKRGFGMSALTSKYATDMNAQIKSYAIEQQKLVVEGKITQEKALQNVQARAYLLADKESQAAAYSRMAIEGKLSVNQMNRLYREGMLTKELIQQLTVMGAINAKQEAVILGGSRLSAIWSTAKTKMGSALSFVGGWWGLAIGAVVGIWQSISSEMDAVEQKAKSLQDSNSDWMKPYTDILSQDKSSSNTELKKQVESMKELLVNSGAYTKTIDDQIKRAKDLNAQYEILKSGVEAAKGRAYGDADVVANAIGYSGGWSTGNPWNDTITENIQQMHESMAKLDTQLSSLDENTRRKMNSIADSFLKPADRSKTLSEKIRLLSEEGGQTWSIFQAKMVTWNGNIAYSMTGLRNAAESTTSDIEEIANDDVPRIIASIQNDLNLYGDNFKRFCQTQPVRFENMLLQIADSADWLVPQIRKKLEELTGFKFPDKKKDPGDTPYNSIQRRVYANLGGNQKQYDLIASYLQDGSWYKTKNNLQGALQDLYNEYKSRSKGGATAQDVADAKKEYDELWNAAYKGTGYKFIPEDKKSNNVPKKKDSTRKEDVELKNLKTRIELYKKLYSEYKKYKDLFGAGALGQLANDGEFAPIFDKKNRNLYPITDYTNYETSIKEMFKNFKVTTDDRRNYRDTEIAEISSKNRELLEKQRSDELSTLNKQLDIIGEQYDTYKKIYELTGNKVGAQKVAFGGTVQYDTYKKFLEEQLDIAVKHDNVQSGLSYSTDDIKNMSLENVKDQYGEETRVYDIRKKLEDETNKIKKETIDLMADLIEKNATIAQQIDDENRSYERQLEIIKGIEDPAMRQRAKEGATKTHNENKAKLQFEQFKQESDWVTIFDDLDRVSSATIDSMVSRIDEFSRTTGLSVEVVKQLRDALDNLRKEQIERNPLPYIFGGVKRGNAIGSFIKDRIGKNASGDSQVFVSSAEGKKMGIVGNKAYTKNQLENEQQGAYDDSSKAINAFAGDMQALSNIMGPVVDLFTALGEQDSVLGKISGGLQSGFSSAASVSSGLNALGLSSLGPYGAAAAAGLSVASSLISAFGADYSSYNKAKEQYDNLSSIWDSLISKKTQYMSIHWGTEATEASKEAQRMLEAEIEQTRIIAQKRLDSGASIGSHSIRYRMWKGSYKYDGQNWQDVASEISRKYGVQFNGMDDLLNMNSETLSQIKQDYVGLWANMDGDFRDYLEKLIEYGEQADDMIDNITEKLTGNKFSSLVESWGDAMSQMSNSSDSLVDNFEDNLKKTIVNSMIENLYKDKINAVLAKAKKYGDPTGGTDNRTNANGDIVSAFTDSEYSEVMGDVEDVAKQIEATLDFLKKTYGWSDNSSSSSTNSVKGITEETADILVSYANAIRLDCSVIRAEQAKYFPEMSEIAKSQLTQLNMITQNTLRNAEAAERIESIFTSYNDNFNKVLNGTKRLNVK